MAYLDIGVIWCATLEIRVGRSDWPQTMEFKPLLPTVMVMSPLECRLDRSVRTTKMFSTKDFSQEVACKLWDRLHIICRQPYRKDVQFGISFIKIRNMNPTSLPELQTNANTDVIQPGKSALGTSSIQKHFFGETAKRNDGSPTDMLKYRLMKMAGSTENGCEQVQALSRTAKLVLTASENNTSCSPRRISPALPRKGLFSEHLAKKNDVPIDEEMKTFLPTLNISAADVDTITIADLRHKFERRKKRKLTREEKSTFSEACQDFFCDLFDNNKTSVEATKSGPPLELNIQKKLSEEITSENLSDKLVTPWSVSKMNKTPKRKRETQLIQKEQPYDSGSPTLSTKNDSYSKVSKSSTSDVYMNQDDFKQILETSTKNKHLSKVSDDHITSSHMTTEVSPSSVLALTFNNNKMSSSAVKKHKKLDIDAEDTHKLVCDKQGLLLKTKHSPHYGTPPSNMREQTLQKQFTVGKDNDSDLISSIHDDSESRSHQKDLKSESLEIVHKIVTKENVNKSHDNNRNKFTKHPVPTLITSSSTVAKSRKPAKLKKMNAASYNLFHEFSMEILDSEDDLDSVSQDNNTEKGLFSDGEKSCRVVPGHCTDLSLKNVPTAGATNVISLTNCSPQNFDLQINETIQKTRTPKSARGKIYRMYTSRDKVKTASHAELVSDSKYSSSVLDIPCHKFDDWVKSRAQNETEFDVDLNRNLSDRTDVTENRQGKINKDVDLSNPTLFDGGRNTEHGKKTIPGGSKQTPRRKNQKEKEHNSRERSTNLPNLQTLTDTAFCDRCYGTYAPDAIYAHRAFCMPQSNHVSTGIANEMLIDEAADYAECPICLQRFPEDVLPVHASECGI